MRVSGGKGCSIIWVPVGLSGSLCRGLGVADWDGTLAPLSLAVCPQTSHKSEVNSLGLIFLIRSKK